MRQFRPAGRGFTLVEMLVVITIIAIVVGLTVPLFMSGRVTTRRNNATNAVKGALAACRQAAVERRAMVAIEFISDPSPDRGDVMVLVDKSDTPDFVANPSHRQLGAPMALPDFVKFDVANPGGEWTLENGWDGDPDDRYDAAATPDICYRPDGTLADWPNTTNIVLIDTGGVGQKMIDDYFNHIIPRVDAARDVIRVLPETGLVVYTAHLQDPSLPEDATTNPKRKGWL